MDINGDGANDPVACDVKVVCNEKGDEIIAFRPELMIRCFNSTLNEFDSPFGIFDPYSRVRDYCKERSEPLNRIVLSEKYHADLQETTGIVTRHMGLNSRLK